MTFPERGWHSVGRVPSITFQNRTSVEDLPEAEAGLGKALGFGVDAPSRIAMALLRPLMWLMRRNTITIDETGIAIPWRFRPWSEFGLAYETENLLCLVITETSGPLTIRKRVLSTKQLDEVRRLIDEHVEATPETMARITQIRTTRR